MSLTCCRSEWFDERRHILLDLLALLPSPSVHSHSELPSSHIACRSHAAPTPFPYHAVPLRVQNVSFPFDLHSAAVSDSHLPCRAHAIPDHAVLLKATAQHGRRETACGLLARIRLLPSTTRSSTEFRRIPISDVAGQCETKHRLHGRGEEWQQHTTKIRSVTLFDQQFGYFRLPCGHSRRTRRCRSRAGARHGMCELTRGMGGERHGRGMLCVNRP